MTNDQCVAVDVVEAGRRLMLPERAVWTAIATGDLRSFKVGRRRLIDVDELTAFVKRTADAAARSAQRTKAATGAVTQPTSAQPASARSVTTKAKRRPAASQAEASGIPVPFVQLPDGRVVSRGEARRIERARSQAGARDRGRGRRRVGDKEALGR